jgi:hypothetical protein
MSYLHMSNLVSKKTSKSMIPRNISSTLQMGPGCPGNSGCAAINPSGVVEVKCICF